MTALKKTLSDDLLGKGPNTEEFLILLLQLYQRMRDRDIVRKQMSNLRKKVKDQQRLAQRDKIASITNKKKPPPAKKAHLSISLVKEKEEHGKEPDDDEINLDDEEMAEEKDDTPDLHILPRNKIL